MSYNMDIYMYMTDAIITYRNDEKGARWEVSTPQDTMAFATKEDLDEYIDENVGIMEELVKEGQIEQELWDEAVSCAHAESDDEHGHDPLDKPATEITVWDVYRPSELL